MHQIKIFKALEFDVEQMEKQVNDWLAKTGARVLSIAGNIAPQGGASSGSGTTQSDVVLFIHYETP